MKLCSKTIIITSLGILSLVVPLIIVGSVNAANSDDIDLEVDVGAVLNVTIPTNVINLNLTPTSTPSFKTVDLAVTVDTNNPTGYTLTMSPSDGTSTSLVRINGTETIPTLADLSGGYTEQTFTTNKWGYKLSSTNYLPFATSNQIATTNAPTSGATSTVTFAAKGDDTLRSGAYNIEIAFVAVANYVPPVTWDQAYTMAEKTKDGNYYIMQDANRTICRNVTIGQTTTVKDSRDGELYVVGKLNDGRCWLLDNLRLDLTNSATLAALTTSNTNADAVSLTSLRSGNRTAGNQYAKYGFATWNSSSSSNTFDQAKANNEYKNTTVTSYGVGSGKVGVYYNYCAATAGSYCYDEATGVGDASYDLCPAGWRMPTGGASGEYQTLYTTYSGDVVSIKTDLSTPLSGYYLFGEVNSQDFDGIFWSPTFYNSNYMYDLNSGVNYVNAQNLNYRNNGLSVRCILK